MTQGPLSRLEKLDLHRYWEREDTDFTPWLAAEENISLLGDAIGLELEVEAQEKEVGPFRADILCRNTADDTLVLIENQLERTDHGHLGQIFTYAAGLEAVTIVWIASRFTDEHRAALDWLNEITDDRFQFFGLEIELWQIGDSPMAPKFNLIAKPNEWSRTVKAGRTGQAGLNPSQKLRVEYWTSFGDYLREQNASIRPPKPGPGHWTGYGVGRSGAYLIAVFKLDEAVVHIELNRSEHPAWFHLLHDQREAIEAELGFPLEWEERPEKKYSFIRVAQVFDSKDRNTWPTIHQWMQEKLEAMRKVFRPRVKALDDSDWTPPEIAEEQGHDG